MYGTVTLDAGGNGNNGPYTTSTNQSAAVQVKMAAQIACSWATLQVPGIGTGSDQIVLNDQLTDTTCAGPQMDIWSGSGPGVNLQVSLGIESFLNSYSFGAHFLFNCLNSIRALVVENPGLAQDMITRFATILRYNLHHDLNHTVPLEAEVEVVSDYLALEAVRLEDRLRVRFAVDPAAGKIRIPPMLLQTLVENAVKHGIATLPNGGDLSVRAAIDADSLRLEVENTGSLSAPKPGTTQVGLGNTRERLRILYGARAHLDLRNGDGRVTATVVIPRTL